MALHAALMLCRYAMGDGVPANLSHAFAIFFKAASMGHARGMCYVAAAYHFGQGVPESRFEALRWCALAFVSTSLDHVLQALIWISGISVPLRWGTD
jgi:TPR repeat protein